MTLSTEDFLTHIVVETEFLLNESSGLEKQKFLKDAVLQRAFVRSIEIIGEAVKRLPGEFRTTHPGIDWHLIAGMRDRLVHGYFGVDYEIVWDVVKNKIPLLEHTVREILEFSETP